VQSNVCACASVRAFFCFSVHEIVCLCVCRLVRGALQLQRFRDALAIDSQCECEHNNPDSLDAQLLPSVVLAVAPAVTMDEASYLLWREQSSI